MSETLFGLGIGLIGISIQLLVFAGLWKAFWQDLK